MDNYYDPAALAELLGIARTSIHRYRIRGDIPEPDDHAGRTPLWRKTTINEWLAGRPGHGWRRGQSKAQPTE